MFVSLTAVNGMMYVCGTDKDYDNWAGVTMDESWNYQSMLPLIKQNHNMQNPKLMSGKCAAYHGTEGPLTVTSNNFDLNEDSLVKF
jgi:choline dehydrogenase-like flavoprotein